jgi:ATP-dependent DNA helicase RecQ
MESPNPTVEDALAAARTDPVHVLRSTFGYDAFRPGQREIIEAVLDGRDCIALMPTGAGKSVTFQIPAKILNGTVLVISPLISLMKDQVDALKANGFNATSINSALDFEERKNRLGRLRRGEYELVYVAPEALDGSLRRFLHDCPIALLVIDEAHCISQWGHDFRTSYRRLQGLNEELDVPVLALTATATRAVARDIIKQLGMSKPAGYKGSFFRHNLHIHTRKKGQGGETRKEILALVKERQGQSGIVYCMSRNAVEQMTTFLRDKGVNAIPYHAGLGDAERARNQDAFARDDADVVVATIAFGMGIDKSNVRYVIHRDMPKDVESWYQEIGRAGRDGLTSDCFVFYSWADVKLHERFLFDIDDDVLRNIKHRGTVHLFEILDGKRCRHQAILQHFDEQIAPCDSSCDVCTGVSGEEVAKQALLKTKGMRSGAGPAPGRTASYTRTARSASDVPEDDIDLFDRLRALRKQIADAQGVPAYIVFSDGTLAAMAAQRPRNQDEMLEVSGVGPAKLEKYGRAFLELLNS